jgi:FO synthase
MNRSAILSDDLDRNLTREEALALVGCDLASLLPAAARRRDAAHGSIVSYSRKVFIPLTKLCRDVCHYCTFAQPPRKGERAYLSLDEVLAIAQAGHAAGCKEALFTLGDQPELRYRTAAGELARLGHRTTLSYLAEAARAVHEQTGLFAHLNPGHLTPSDVAALRVVSLSQGLMLESASERLCERGGPHHGSPDKHPPARLASIRAAGEQRVPFTSGILIGIGETREERIDSLLALRALNDAYGHIQEIIIQNFRPKAATRMAHWPAPSLEDHLWTIAIARLLFAPSMNIQAPPNLNPDALPRLIDAGINDWGGVSPVTPDHVNPEAPWPHLPALERATNAAGKQLVERLAIYPAFARRADGWVDPALRQHARGSRHRAAVSLPRR